LLLGAGLLTGCMQSYDITLVNGTKMTHVTKPKLDKKAGVYTFKDMRGEKRAINAGRVVEIAPHSDKKIKPGTPL